VSFPSTRAKKKAFFFSRVAVSSGKDVADNFFLSGAGTFADGASFAPGRHGSSAVAVAFRSLRVRRASLGGRRTEQTH